MGTVGDGDKVDGDGWGWGQIPVPVQLSTGNTENCRENLTYQILFTLSVEYSQSNKCSTVDEYNVSILSQVHETEAQVRWCSGQRRGNRIRVY